MSSHVRRFVFSWVALVAILMITLAPSVSGLLAAQRGQDGVLCSALRVATSVDGASAPDSPAAPHVLDHCPYCALHAELAPPPRPAIVAVAAAVPFRAQPAAFLGAPRTSWVWSASQPRAPPVVA